jgi:hypothetical protein
MPDDLLTQLDANSAYAALWNRGLRETCYTVHTGSV